MNELLKINYENDRPTVSGRDLHKALEVETQYSVWFGRMSEYGFVEKIDYMAVNQKRLTAQGNETAYVDHQLTIPMAKEIAMIQRNEKGKQIRQYFIVAEENWNRPEMVLARANKIQARMLEVANEKVFLLQAENAALKPKAEFYDAVANSDSAISLREAAMVLNIPGIGQNKLFRWLRDNGILTQDNLPYQVYVDRGYFRVIEQSYSTKDGEIVTTKTLILQKGLDYIRRRLNETRERELYGV